MIPFKRLLISLLVAASVSAHAVELPKPSPADPRVKTVRYNARDVVRLKTHALYTTHVRFAPYEKITNLAVGDSITWLVVESADKNAIFIKPTEAGLATNLIVTTDQRVYAFELTSDAASSAQSDDLNFLLSFDYPEDELARERARQEASRHAQQQVVSPEPVGPEAWNLRYEYSGSRETKPDRVFDDGKFTYFDFGSREVPAIFAVDAERNESVVNFHKRGRFIVVERLERQFTLRHGRDVTCIFNTELAPADGRRHRRAPV